MALQSPNHESALLKSLLVGLLRHSLLISLITGGVTAAALYYVFNTTPMFRATASLLIETPNSNIASNDESNSENTQDSEYYETQIEILRSRNLATRVVNSLNLWNHPELTGQAPKPEQQESLAYQVIHSTIATGSSIFGRVWSRIKSMVTGEAQPIIVSVPIAPATEMVEPVVPATDLAPDANSPANAVAMQAAKRSRIVERLMSGITIVPVGKTKFVKIEYVSADPTLASRVANAVGLQYIQSVPDSKASASDRAPSWLDEQLKTLKAQLVDSEQRLLEYKRANGVMDFNSNVERLKEQERLVGRDLAAAKNRLAEARNVYAKAQSLREFPGGLDTLPEFQNDPVVRRMSAEIGLLKQELQELSNRYGQRHPRRVAAKSKYDELLELREANVARVLGSLEQKASLAATRVRAFERDLASARSGIENIASKGVELEALETEVATNQTLYDTFFAGIPEARSADGLENATASKTANATISDFAVPPARPFKPRKALIVGAAALSALIFSLLLSWLLERLNRTIRAASDVESIIGIKLLGITPTIKSKWSSRRDRKPISPLGSGGTDVEFLEAIDSISAELHSSGLLDDKKVVLITSSEPDEGKTTVAVNLAHSLAQQERVLLIDCDLRRPSVAGAMGLDARKPGLTDVLSDLNAISKVLVRRVGSSNLDVIPAGSPPDRPIRTLMSNNLACVLMVARRYYDRIIIDTPPVHAVSDALVISKLVDTCIYVGASHSTSVNQAKRGLKRLDDAGANVAGFIVSRVDIKKLSKIGGEGFQGYYDMYGYTSKVDIGADEFKVDKHADTPDLLGAQHEGQRRRARAL